MAEKLKVVVFSEKSIIDKRNPIQYMVSKLIRKGAPIKINRESILNPYDLTEDEIEVYGDLHLENDLFNNFKIYSWTE